MAEPLETIVELQRALDELKSTEELLGGIPDWMQELHEEHSRQRATIDSLRAEVEEAAQARRAAEAEIADLRAKVKHFQDQIGKVRNQREYGALLQEIDAAKQRMGGFEEQALADLERQEEANQRLRQEQESFEGLDATYAGELAKWEAQKPEVEEQAAKLRERIGALKQHLPRSTLTLFERIRERHHGQALAPIRQVERGGKLAKIWHCGACNFRVRPQAVVAVQTQGKIETCDSCKRILYLEEDPG